MPRTITIQFTDEASQVEYLQYYANLLGSIKNSTIVKMVTANSENPDIIAGFLAGYGMGEKVWADCLKNSFN